jgi:hypothetical protein
MGSRMDDESAKKRSDHRRKATAESLRDADVGFLLSPQMNGRISQDNLERRPNRPCYQMAAARGAIRQAQNHMDMQA